MEIYVWLGITVLALIIEALTNDLVSIWFAGGGLAALILSACKVPWYINIAVFIVVSLALVLSLRKFALRFLDRGEEKTNADAVFGKEYVLLTEIKLNCPGTIKVNDVIWSAVCEKQDEEVLAGTLVRVIRLKGNKYVVEPVKQVK